MMSDPSEKLATVLEVLDEIGGTVDYQFLKSIAYFLKIKEKLTRTQVKYLDCLYERAKKPLKDAPKMFECNSCNKNLKTLDSLDLEGRLLCPECQIIKAGSLVLTEYGMMEVYKSEGGDKELILMLRPQENPF